MPPIHRPAATTGPVGEEPTDTLGRPLRDLRVSVTDRCNFRCPYCMPRDQFGPDHAFLARSDLLTFEEITRVATAAADLGVGKVRLTGGEPLLRHDLPSLVGMLATIDGIDDLALTTNGSLLTHDLAADLADAGLDRVTVSLDSLDPRTFSSMSDTKIPLERVIDGIDAAIAAGLAPVKLNCVVQRGRNEHEVADLVTFAMGRGAIMRFIEYMDVGTTNGWDADNVVPAAEILERVATVHPLEPIGNRPRGEVASRYRIAGCETEIGIVASVTAPFCGDCSRLRLSAIGELFTCLFAARGHDLRALVRDGADRRAIGDEIAAVWMARTDRYSEQRAGTPVTLSTPRVEMSYIGG
ncbi:MAG TPA: GTP 3',8-cyclase MoaA [Acidimicrobiales bacterium]